MRHLLIHTQTRFSSLPTKQILPPPKKIRRPYRFILNFILFPFLSYSGIATLGYAGSSKFLIQNIKSFWTLFLLPLVSNEFDFNFYLRYSKSLIAWRVNCFPVSIFLFIMCFRILRMYTFLLMYIYKKKGRQRVCICSVWKISVYNVYLRNILITLSDNRNSCCCTARVSNWHPRPPSSPPLPTSLIYPMLFHK